MQAESNIQRQGRKQAFIQTKETHSSKLPFALLRPLTLPPRLENLEILTIPRRSDGSPELSVLDFIWEGRAAGQGPMALDFETRGDLLAEDAAVVGLALTDERGSVGIDIRETPEAYAYVVSGLYTSGVQLLAHNAYYDAGWVYRDFILAADGTPMPRPKGDTSPGLLLRWTCTYALYKYLANEDWIGQRHGLKEAQRDLLGWDEKGDVELSEWLVANGYISSVSKEPKDGYFPVPNYGGKGELRYCSPDKGEMWRAPKDVLIYYCALDTESTWLLYTYVLLPVLRKFPVLEWYAGPLYLKILRTLLENKFRGILLDEEYMNAYETFLKAEADRTFQEFISYPDVASFRQLLREAAVMEQIEKEPPKIRKGDVPKEPNRPRLNKDGSVNKQWLSYEEKLQTPIPPSPRWLAWSEKLREIEAEEHFNPNSGPQMQTLVYEWLCKPVAIRTESGAPSTGKKVLRGFPEMQPLIEHIGYKKELSLIESIRRVSLRNEEGQRIYHPSFRVPRTSTGRLGGSGNFNVQNVKKSPYMHIFKARPGYVVWSFDVASLEQVVLAELSRDPVLWNFYGPDAKPGNCIYLYEGSNYPVLGEHIRAAGYNPNQWTPESVAKAKKAAKKWRDIAKVFVLSGSYGAGATKVQETLKLGGVDISLEDCQKIIRARRELYSGVKRWEDTLLSQWKNNGGWVLNGIGRPQAIAEDFLKDRVNRTVQSSGHDLLLILVAYLADVVREEGLDAHPWIADVHDATYWEVKEGEAKRFTDIFTAKVLPFVNRYVRAVIPLTGEPAIVRTLGEDKEMPRFWEIKQKRGEELTPIEQALADLLEELEEETGDV